MENPYSLVFGKMPGNYIIDSKMQEGFGDKLK